MTDLQLAAQIVGGVGLICIVLTWQFNKRRTILYIQLFSALVWTLHYILLGAFAGASMNFMSAIRNLLFDRYRDKWYVFWGSIVAFAIADILTWQNWTSILPFIGSTIAIISMWQKKPQRIRWIYAFVMPFWFAYNALNGSYVGMIGDSISMASVLFGIFRFDILPSLKRRYSEV